MGTMVTLEVPEAKGTWSSRFALALWLLTSTRTWFVTQAAL